MSPCFSPTLFLKQLKVFEPLFSDLLKGNNNTCLGGSMRQERYKWLPQSLEHTGAQSTRVLEYCIFHSHRMFSKVTLSFSLYLRPGLPAPWLHNLCVVQLCTQCQAEAMFAGCQRDPLQLFIPPLTAEDSVPTPFLLFPHS